MPGVDAPLPLEIECILTEYLLWARIVEPDATDQQHLNIRKVTCKNIQRRGGANELMAENNREKTTLSCIGTERPNKRWFVLCVKSVSAVANLIEAFVNMVGKCVEKKLLEDAMV